MRRRRDPAGFTLIELLVVIAIIARGHARWIGTQSRQVLTDSARAMGTRAAGELPVPLAN